MNNDPIDILSEDNNINDQQLMDYLNGKLTAKEMIEMDKLIAASGLMDDALQGLQQFKDTTDLSVYVNQLNSGLHNQLQKKKWRRRKLKLKNEQWIYFAVILILVLVIIGFIIIRERLGK